MKLLEQPTFRVNIDGAESFAKQYQITANKKAFQILADGIYKHKIKAIIRELSANARDAHIAAGHNDPFTVHLPTKNNPVFSIEDCGTGLSPAKVDEVYTKFFESDKLDSDELVGCLGLGAKSPFCYNSRSFTVESWYDGIHYIYSNYVDEYGIPSYTLLTSSSTDRGNGVKITIPVDANDIYQFLDDAKEVYKWFDVKPKIIGNSIHLDEIKYKYEGTGWKYIDKSYYGTTTIIMGGIAYAVDSQYAIGYYTVVLFAEMGEIDFDSAREGVAYTKKTLAFLAKAKKQFAGDVKKIIEDGIASCKNKWQAKQALSKYHSDFNLNDSYKFNNEEITNGNIYLPDNQEAISIYKGYDNIKKNKRRYIYVSDTVIINDLEKTGHARIRQYVDNNKGSLTLVDMELDALKELLGCDDEDILLTSELDYEKPTRTHTKGPQLLDIMLFDPDTLTQKETWIKPTSKPVGGVYLIRDGYKTVINGVEEDYHGIKELIKKVARIGITVPDIYGIRKRDIDKLDSNWEPLEEWIKRKEQLVKDKEYGKNVQNYSNFQAASVVDILEQELFNNLSLPKDHQIKVFLSNQRKMDRVLHKMNILEYFGYKTVDPEIDILGEYTKIVEKYPLLPLLGKIEGDKLKIVENYILSIDKGGK